MPSSPNSHPELSILQKDFQQLNIESEMRIPSDPREFDDRYVDALDTVVKTLKTAEGNIGKKWIEDIVELSKSGVKPEDTVKLLAYFDRGIVDLAEVKQTIQEINRNQTLATYRSALGVAVHKLGENLFAFPRECFSFRSFVYADEDRAVLGDSTISFPALLVENRAFSWVVNEIGTQPALLKDLLTRQRTDPSTLGTVKFTIQEHSSLLRNLACTLKLYGYDTPENAKILFSKLNPHDHQKMEQLKKDSIPYIHSFIDSLLVQEKVNPEETEVLHLLKKFYNDQFSAALVSHRRKEMQPIPEIDPQRLRELRKGMPVDYRTSTAPPTQAQVARRMASHSLHTASIGEKYYKERRRHESYDHAMERDLNKKRQILKNTLLRVWQAYAPAQQRWENIEGMFVGGRAGLVLDLVNVELSNGTATSISEAKIQEILDKVLSIITAGDSAARGILTSGWKNLPPIVPLSLILHTALSVEVTQTKQHRETIQKIQLYLDPHLQVASDLPIPAQINTIPPAVSQPFDPDSQQVLGAITQARENSWDLSQNKEGFLVGWDNNVFFNKAVEKRYTELTELIALTREKIAQYGKELNSWSLKSKVKENQYTLTSFLLGLTTFFGSFFKLIGADFNPLFITGFSLISSASLIKSIYEQQSNMERDLVDRSRYKAFSNQHYKNEIPSFRKSLLENFQENRRFLRIMATIGIIWGSLFSLSSIKDSELFDMDLSSLTPESLDDFFSDIEESAGAESGIGNMKERPPIGDPEFAIFGQLPTDGSSFWMREIKVAQRDTVELQSFSGENAHFTQVTQAEYFGTKADLQTAIDAQVQQGNIVRFNASTSDSYMESLTKYTPVGLLVWGNTDTVQVTGEYNLLYGVKLDISGQHPEKIGVIYAPIKEGDKTTQSILDLPFQTQINQVISPEARESGGELAHLQEIISEVTSMGKIEGVTVRQRLERIKAWMDEHGMEYGFSDFDTPSSTVELLRQLTEMKNGQFVEDKQICNQMSYVVYMIARLAGMTDVYLSSGYAVAPDHWGGWDFQRHQVVVYLEKGESDLPIEGRLQVFEATLPGTQNLYPEFGRVAAARDSVLNETTISDKLHAVSTRDVLAYMMLGGMALGGGVAGRKEYRRRLRIRKHQLQEKVESLNRDAPALTGILYNLQFQLKNIYQLREYHLAKKYDQLAQDYYRENGQEADSEQLEEYVVENFSSQIEEQLTGKIEQLFLETYSRIIDSTWNGFSLDHKVQQVMLGGEINAEAVQSRTRKKQSLKKTIQSHLDGNGNVDDETLFILEQISKFQEYMQREFQRTSKAGHMYSDQSRQRIGWVLDLLDSYGPVDQGKSVEVKK